MNEAHTHILYELTRSHATSAVYKNMTRISTAELSVLWLCGISEMNRSSLFCSDISLWAQSSLAFTRCRVTLGELLEIFRGEVLCLTSRLAHHSETSHTDSEHVPLWPSMSFDQNTPEDCPLSSCHSWAQKDLSVFKGVCVHNRVQMKDDTQSVGCYLKISLN